MTDRYNDWASGPRDEVAYVCGQLERIRADLQAHGAEGAAPLERLLTALHNGEDPTVPLCALHEALLAAGDAAGIQGQARGLNPIGVGPAVPAEWVLLCPTHQCSRHTWPHGSEEPRCRISGQHLRRERL